MVATAPGPRTPGVHYSATDPDRIHTHMAAAPAATRRNLAKTPALQRTHRTCDACTTAAQHHREQKMQQPTVGRIVHYTLSEQDAAAINKRRDDFSAYRRAAAKSGDPTAGATGHIGHYGNHAAAGQTCAAVIVRVWDTEPSPSCNLQVLLDGNDTYWATSRHEGDGNGRWSWPPRT